MLEPEPVCRHYPVEEAERLDGAAGERPDGPRNGIIQVLFAAGVAVTVGAVAIWRWRTAESELGQPGPVQEVEGNNEKGIYAWYADRDGQSVLSKVGLRVRDDGLVYIGSTTDDYDYRIVRCHLRGTVRNHPPGTRGYGSTLRRSLAGVLCKVTGRASEQQVTHFMNAHLRVALKPMTGTVDSIRQVESKLILKYEPALNIKNLRNDNSKLLRRMRETVKHDVPELFQGEGA